MKLIDLTGQRFGRLVVIKRAENQGRQTKWLCKCDCGNVVAVMGSRLRGNITHSCGCIQKEVTRERLLKHGGSTSKLRSVWKNMISRCYPKMIKSTLDMELEESGFVVNGESEAFAPWIELITTETIRQKIADSYHERAE